MPKGLSSSGDATQPRHHVEDEAWVYIVRADPLIEVVLLSLAMIVTAWTGYSAAKSSAQSRRDLAGAMRSASQGGLR
jgi:hypothetical protein